MFGVPESAALPSLRGSHVSAAWLNVARSDLAIVAIYKHLCETVTVTVARPYATPRRPATASKRRDGDGRRLRETYREEQG